MTHFPTNHRIISNPVQNPQIGYLQTTQGHIVQGQNTQNNLLAPHQHQSTQTPSEWQIKRIAFRCGLICKR